MTMGSRDRRRVDREWDKWLEGLGLNQVEHVLLSLTDERQELNDKLRRMRAKLASTVSDRDGVKVRIDKARRRLARLHKVTEQR